MLPGIAGVIRKFINNGLKSLWVLRSVKSAEVGKKAVRAIGLSGLADVAAMQDQPVVGSCEFCIRDVFYQLHLGLQRVFSPFRKPDPLRHPENMGINCHGRKVKGYRSNHIGGFPSHPGKLLQRIHISGNLTAKITHQHLSHPREVGCLIVGVGAAFDLIKDGFRGSDCKRKNIRKSLEETRSNLIYPHIGALCRKNHCHNELIRIAVHQLGGRIGVVLTKQRKHLTV